MRTWIKGLGLLMALLFTLAGQAQIEKVVPKRPSPPKLVNDFTGTLTDQQTSTLEQKLVAYDDSTSNQVVVVIIPTLDDYPVEDVALAILRGWGVGNKGTNNGVVLLVAKNDRKVRIETGYGLEGAIPDGTASTIIQSDIIPQFKLNNYYRGIDEAVESIMKAAAGEYKAPKGYGSKKKDGMSPLTIAIIVVVLLLIFGFGAAGGAAGGTIASGRGFRGWNTGGSWGGFGGGGSGGGGWSGGGGFGGFGGGSGGGGGASGSW